MKAPAFQLYSNDFLVDTLDWSIEEIGIYTRLLFFQWANGCIPNDTERLARIAGCHTQKFIPNWKKVSSKFVQKDEGFLYNVRLEETRIEQEEFKEKAIESGKLGAEKRWKDHIKKDSNPISNPISNPNGENIALLSSSSSSSIKEKKESIKKKDLPAHIFVKPSFEEITAYCQERKNNVNPQKWLDHYTANGWKIGKALAPMKDWKAAVRTWEGNNYDNNGNGKAPEPEKFPAYIDRSGDPFAEEMAAYKRGELK